MSPIHSHTHAASLSQCFYSMHSFTVGNVVQCFAQGRFDIRPGQARSWATDLPFALPPELQPPLHDCSNSVKVLSYDITASAINSYHQNPRSDSYFLNFSLRGAWLDSAHHIYIPNCSTAAYCQLYLCDSKGAIRWQNISLLCWHINK